MGGTHLFTVRGRSGGHRGPLSMRGALLGAALAVLGCAPAQVELNGGWVRTWGAAMLAPEDYEDCPGVGRAFHDVTLRQGRCQRWRPETFELVFQ